jgi:hypothetical protein
MKDFPQNKSEAIRLNIENDRNVPRHTNPALEVSLALFSA